MLEADAPVHQFIMTEREKFTVEDIYYYREYSNGRSIETISSAVKFLLTFKFISIVEYGMFGVPIYKVRL